jgi:hypothetical protein
MIIPIILFDSALYQLWLSIEKNTIKDAYIPIAW